MNLVRVLLVDDEVTFTENMAELLTTRGYAVTEAHNGWSAIRIVEKGEVDVVVLDLKMPGIDGIATLKEIKELDTFAEVLVLTGHGSVDSAIEAMKLGAYDYLTKPCEVEELVEKLAKAKLKTDDARGRDLENKVQRIVESPRAALSLFSRKGKKRR